LQREAQAALLAVLADVRTGLWDGRSSSASAGLLSTCNVDHSTDSNPLPMLGSMVVVGAKDTNPDMLLDTHEDMTNDCTPAEGLETLQGALMHICRRRPAPVQRSRLGNVLNRHPAAINGPVSLSQLHFTGNVLLVQ
jgi:hypothetical protein